MNEYEFERMKQRDREDKRAKMLGALGIIAATLVIGGIVLAIALGGKASAERFQEFQMACLERGGTVVSVASAGGGTSNQCVQMTTMTEKETP